MSFGFAWAGCPHGLRLALRDRQKCIGFNDEKAIVAEFARSRDSAATSRFRVTRDGPIGATSSQVRDALASRAASDSGALQRPCRRPAGCRWPFAHQRRILPMEIASTEPAQGEMDSFRSASACRLWELGADPVTANEMSADPAWVEGLLRQLQIHPLAESQA
jgi:hypothetical protein